MSFWIFVSCLAFASLETALSRNGAEYYDKTASYFLRRGMRNNLQFQRSMPKLDNRKDNGLRGEDENGDEDYLKRNSETLPPYYKLKELFPEFRYSVDRPKRHREFDWSELRRLEDEFLSKTRELENKDSGRPKRYEDDPSWRDLEEMDEEKRQEYNNEGDRVENELAKRSNFEEKREFTDQKSEDVKGEFLGDQKRDDVSRTIDYLVHDKRGEFKKDNSDFRNRDEDNADNFVKRRRDKVEDKHDDFAERKRENIKDVDESFDTRKREVFKDSKDAFLSRKRGDVEETTEELDKKKRESIMKKEDDMVAEKSRKMDEKRDHFAEEYKGASDEKKLVKKDNEEDTPPPADEDGVGGIFDRQLNDTETDEQEEVDATVTDASSLQCENFVDGVELGKGERECCSKQSSCPVISFMGTLGHTCYCDKEFYNCLRMVDTPLAIDIATFYFNEMKSRCFTYEEKRECQQQSCVTVQTIESIKPPEF